MAAGADYDRCQLSELAKSRELRDQSEWAERFFIDARGERNWINEFFAEVSTKRQKFKEELEQLSDSIIAYLGC